MKHSCKIEIIEKWGPRLDKFNNKRQVASLKEKKVKKEGIDQLNQQLDSKRKIEREKEGREGETKPFVTQIGNGSSPGFIQLELHTESWPLWALEFRGEVYKLQPVTIAARRSYDCLWPVSSQIHKVPSWWNLVHFILNKINTTKLILGQSPARSRVGIARFMMKTQESQILLFNDGLFRTRKTVGMRETMMKIFPRRMTLP